MTEQVDTGFDDVIAGEKWEEPQPSITVREYTSTPHVCAGKGATCDTCFAPITATVIPDEEIKAPILITPPGLTPEGVQAAKALVHLPQLDVPTLAKLARDVAMDIKERTVILQEYKLTQVQYDFLEAHNDFFRNALAAASIEWHAPLSTAERIKVEAAAILEDSLPGLGARMQNKSEGLPGVIEAAKLFAKVAGVGERESGSTNSGERFTINIDLGGDQKITVTTAPPQGEAAQPDLIRQISTDP